MLPEREEVLAAGMKIAAQLEIKDRDYGSSWRKYVGIGAFMNLARKFDRIETQGRARGRDILVLANDARRDGCRDDIGDFVGYGLLTQNFLRDHKTSVQWMDPKAKSDFSHFQEDIEAVLETVLIDPQEWDDFGGTGIYIEFIKSWRRLESYARKNGFDLWEILSTIDEAVEDFHYLLTVSMTVLAATESTKSVPVSEVTSTPRARRGAKEETDGEAPTRRNFGWKTTEAGCRALLRGYIKLRSIASEEDIAKNTVGTYITATDMANHLRNAVPEVFKVYEETMGKPVEDEVLHERFRKMWSQGHRTTEHPFLNHALKEALAKDTSFSEHERSLFVDELPNPMAGISGK